MSEIYVTPACSNLPNACRCRRIGLERQGGVHVPAARSASARECGVGTRRNDSRWLPIITNFSPVVVGLRVSDKIRRAKVIKEVDRNVVGAKGLAPKRCHDGGAKGEVDVRPVRNEVLVRLDSDIRWVLRALRHDIRVIRGARVPGIEEVDGCRDRAATRAIGKERELEVQLVVRLVAQKNLRSDCDAVTPLRLINNTP